MNTKAIYTIKEIDKVIGTSGVLLIKDVSDAGKAVANAIAYHYHTVPPHIFPDHPEQ